MAGSQTQSVKPGSSLLVVEEQLVELLRSLGPLCLQYDLGVDDESVFLERSCLLELQRDLLHQLLELKRYKRSQKGLSEVCLLWSVLVFFVVDAVEVVEGQVIS